MPGTLALLDLYRGGQVMAVARRYRVRRDIVYAWATRLRRRDLRARRRFRAPRGVHPAWTRRRAERLQLAPLGSNPRRHG